jgi:hypothetical protein
MNRRCQEGNLSGSEDVLIQCQAEQADDPALKKLAELAFRLTNAGNSINTAGGH